jgi:aminopeptidase YwaD
MFSKTIRYVLLSIIIIGCHPSRTSYVSYDITVRELQAHVKYLASDELEGRASGTKGNEQAARYIADRFSNYGLQPMGDNGTFFQEFQVLTGLIASKKNNLTITVNGKKIDLTPNEDFIPLSFSEDTSVTSSLVFVGYGISADSLQYDDYAGVDVTGKVAVVLRYSPDYGRPDSKFYAHAPLYRKAFTARSRGAAGMILVTGPSDEEKPSLIPLRTERSLSTAGIPAVNIKSPVVDSLLLWAGSRKTLKTLQQEIYDTKLPKSFEIPNVQISMTAAVERVYSPTANVIGYLEGSDPMRKDEVVIVGAHFDHVGWGGPGSGSMQSDTTAIHNGADDNASGTAAMLEIAQAISADRHQLRRSYLFMGFSGEELGLLGSAHYVKQPTIPLEKTVAMINLDMVGRLRDSSLSVEGVGSSPLWQPLVEKINEKFNFKLKYGQGGFGSSDHASFYGKNIPVLFFFTGLHDDYHRPSDDWNKINYHGQQTVAQFAWQVIRGLEDSEKPVFARAEMSSSGTASRRGLRVTFGIVPDYSEGDNGLKISGTRSGSPAEKAGLKGGDVITQMGGKDVKSIYDLTYLMEDYNPGDEVEVVYTRNGERKSVKVKFEAPRRSRD